MPCGARLHLNANNRQMRIAAVLQALDGDDGIHVVYGVEIDRRIADGSVRRLGGRQAVDRLMDAMGIEPILVSVLSTTSFRTFVRELSPLEV